MKNDFVFSVIFHAVMIVSVLPLSESAAGAFLKPGEQNMVIILMDSLSPDHLGVYGYAKDTSPNIDAIAKRGIIFTAVYSVSNWTNPTIKSIFTGLSPQAVMREALHKEAIRMPLPMEVDTFAELVFTATAPVDPMRGYSPRVNFSTAYSSSRPRLCENS